MTTKLKNISQRPFKGGWTDWHADIEQEDKFAVVTPTTYKFHVYENRFFQDCVNYKPVEDVDAEQLSIEQELNLDKKKIVEPENFDGSKVLQPGVYKDAEISENGAVNCYTIILEYDYMDWKIVKGAVEEKLNNKYGEDFKLYCDCLKCGEETRIGEHYQPGEEDDWKDVHAKEGMVFCSQKCFKEYEQ